MRTLFNFFLLTYKRTHFLDFLTTGGIKLARIASSNMFFKPFCDKAEHSRYLTEPISLAIVRPCGYVIGDNFRSFNFSNVFGLSRRSSFVPTSMIGVFAQ